MVIFMIFVMIIYFLFAVCAQQNQLFINYILRPPGVDCHTLAHHSTPQQFANMAYAEDKVLDAAGAVIDPMGTGFNPDINGQTSRTGALTCFCQKQFELGKDGNALFKVQDSQGNAMFKPICKQYNTITASMGLGTLLDMCYGQMVVIANYVGRVLFIYFASLIRFTTYTKETNFIMLSVFWMQFFNSGLLFAVAPFDAREGIAQRWPIVGKIFNGIYPDYNANWFGDVGVTVCAALFSQMFWPLIEFWAFFGMRYFFRVLDQRTLIPNKYNKTSNKTLQAFENMYAGPVFSIHYKYSFIMNVTFVTFLFGPGMPILFPIAWFAIFLQYTMERLMMAYSYRKPIMYDSEINRNCLAMLSLAPIVYVFSAAWTFSNQQVFFGEVVFDKNDLLFANTNHSPTQLWKQLSPATPYVVPLTIFLFVFIGKLLTCCVKVSKSVLDDQVLHQSLEPFFVSLKARTRETWLREEVTSKKVLDISKLSEEAFTRLAKFKDKSKKGVTKLTGVHNYDILANPYYADQYHYIPCFYPQRSQYVIS